ncbi:MAG: 2-oxoacid:acceptor oxidoreductase family protein [Deltaproteobacteria bacterium]|nr:2-oxoacid:acceptor oxidoreductase family protein [Deltaproteobacteria bacterium]
MIEIVFVGRGGQGAVTASQIAATAAFQEGKFAQAFPSFGPERRGAPVTAYARVDDKPIVFRHPVDQADYLIVLDPNIFKVADPFVWLKAGGTAVLNLDRPAPGGGQGARAVRVDASAISEQIYGPRPIPITNVAMLGALAAVADFVELENILDVIDRFFPAAEADRAKTSARLAHQQLEGAESP